MVFTNQDFIDMLNFFKDKNCFSKNAKESFESITEISKSESGESLIKSNHCLYNLDNIAYNLSLNSQGNPNSIPASVDALFYFNNNNFTLYLIEFKGVPINSLDYKEILKLIKMDLEKDKCVNFRENCPISDNLMLNLTRTYERYEDGIFCSLKIKPIESLFVVLPKLYKKYCDELDKNYYETISGFMDWLLKVNKKLYVVFLDDKNKSKIYKKNISNKIDSKYKYLKSFVNLEHKCYNQKTFEDVFVSMLCSEN